MTTAAEQITAMRAALEDIEREMVDGADDPTAFATLEQRRSRMLGEVARLEFLERREAAEAREAHRKALQDRLAEARARYAELCRVDIPDIEAELIAIADRLDHLLPRCQAITSEVNGLASQESNAIGALRKAGEAPGHSTIGAPPVPSHEIAVRYWQAGHEIVGKAGLDPGRSGVLQQTQRRA